MGYHTAFTKIFIPFSASFITLALGSVSIAATYYVATNGSDIATCGSSSAPCKTITYAYAKVSPGDTVIVRPGIYTEFKPSYGIHLNKSGTSTVTSTGIIILPITIKSETKWGAIIDGQITTAGGIYPYTGQHQDGFYVSGDYQIIDGFDIRNSARSGVSLYGSNNKVINNNIHNNGNYGDPNSSIGHDGAEDGDSDSGNQFIGNYIHDNGRSACGGQTYCNLDHGLYVYGDNILIANNLIVRSQANGIVLASRDGQKNVKVYNNVFAWNNHAAAQGGIMIWTLSGTLAFSGIDIRNNIFYKNTGYAITSYQAHGSGVIFDKNIFFGNYATIYNTGSGSDYTYTMGISLNLDPKFVNETSDFQLQSTSPAINAGATLPEVQFDYAGVSRPQGGAYDIGAYELVSLTSTAVKPRVPAGFQVN